MLAALTAGRLQAEEGGEERNVRNISEPELIKAVVKSEGWSIKEEKVVVPPKGLHDGRWEVLNLLSGAFQREVEEIAKQNEGLGGVLKSMKGAVVGALEVVEGGVKGVETMSVWVGKMDKGPGLLSVEKVSLSD